jgi:hypothetical protein
MHQVIRAIVYADNKEEALDKAKGVFERLCGEDGHTFDYFTTFDDNSSEMSGPARWGKLPVVALANSKEGKKLIDDGMKWIRQTYMENLQKAKEMIKNYSDEELFEEKILDSKTQVVQRLTNTNHNLSMARYYFYCVGEWKGSNIWLYDNDGEGIRNSGHLKDVLNKWGEHKDKKVYVVPADVHY